MSSSGSTRGSIDSPVKPGNDEHQGHPRARPEDPHITKFITVINKWVNISAFEGSPPSGGADRKYPQGPVYEIEDVERLAAQGSLQFWTRGAARDAQKWKLDTKDCAKLMQLALHSGRFTGSEWCQQQPQGPWAMCDAYSVSRPEWIEHAGKHLNVSYYLKFAISKTGQLLLMASNHPEGA